MLIRVLRPLRALTAPLALYTALTAILTLPLLRSFASVFPHDAGDPVLNTWILWWSTRRVPLTHAWWNAPMFFPTANAMAFSEVLVGLLPISAPVQLATQSPLVSYNAAFLLSFPLCGFAAYALALEITGRRDAALGAGLAFAFAPYRITQLGHLQMLSYYWAPLSLVGLHRYLRTRTLGSLALFGSAWLMQSLSNGYAMFHVAVLLALWIVWFLRSPRAILPVAIAWLVFALPLVPILLTYERVHTALHLVRDINEIKRSGADLVGFFSAPPDSLMWGGRLPTASNETAVFPGLTVIGLAVVAWALRARRARWDLWVWSPGTIAAAAVAAIAGAVAASVFVVGPWAVGSVLTVSQVHKPFSIAVLALVALAVQSATCRRAWRTRSVIGFYVLATIVMYLLAMGPAPTVFGRPLLYEPPYAWLMRLPGFDVLRVPARFAMAAVLCQAVLVAFALAQWSAAVNRRVLATVVCAGLLLDGAFRLPVEAAPARAPVSWADVATVVELPAGGPAVDFPAIYRSMFHGRPVVNGYSGYMPPHYLPLVHAIRDQQYDALREVSAYGTVGIAIDEGARSAVDLAHHIAALPDVRPLTMQPGWLRFVAPAHPPALVRVGPRLTVARIAANRHPEDLSRLVDGHVDTAWGSGADQQGGEELVVDFGSSQEVAAVVFEMGAFSFGYPRLLVVDVSPDAATWKRVWQGPTAVQTVRAALAKPEVVPITIAFDPSTARYVRFQQSGRELGIPWWIAELELHAR